MPTRADARDATRARVLVSARRLFERKGFTATTVRDIAHDADVSVGTVMSVGDKSGLLVAGFDARIEALHADLSRAAHVHSLSQDDCAEAVLALLTPFIDLFEAHPDLSRSYGAILLSGEHESRAFTELRERLMSELQDAFIRAAGCTTEDASRRATTTYLVYLGALLEWASASDTATAALAERVRRAIGPIVTALRKDTDR